jgi:uncharacterized protein (TIGR00255 family)
MVTSMTGFGRGSASEGGRAVNVEVRSVNSRFLDLSVRLPRSLSVRENEAKEQVRRRISRGKISVLVSVASEGDNGIPVRVNAPAARSYYRLLKDLRKTLRIKETVKLAHLLEFPDIFESGDSDTADDQLWSLAAVALDAALEDLNSMRRQEGRELRGDFRERITALNTRIDAIEGLSRDQVPSERERLRSRIAQLLEKEPVDEGRLELELALLADRLDVTEECVRFRSHNKFFLEALDDPEPAGRRLNFLVQEMHRETNTIGSKSSATAIAHLVVAMKEELEKIREQLQNIE